MKIYVVRHGETDWNSIGKLQGQTDIELNDIGRNQALQTGNLIKDEKIDLIFSSPLKDEDKHEFWIIEIKESNEPVGNISVNTVNKKHNYCNVGYVVRFDYQGHGYASEALKKVTDYLLSERNYYLVECSSNELNIASTKTMLKAGFKKDGYIANRRLNDDGIYSGIEFYSKGK